jgi:hypothetical protein
MNAYAAGHLLQPGNTPVAAQVISILGIECLEKFETSVTNPVVPGTRIHIVECFCLIRIRENPQNGNPKLKSSRRYMDRAITCGKTCWVVLGLATQNTQRLLNDGWEPRESVNCHTKEGSWRLGSPI